MPVDRANELTPLGVFGIGFSLRRLPELRRELRALIGQIDFADRAELASYLRNGTVERIEGLVSKLFRENPLTLKGLEDP